MLKDKYSLLSEYKKSFTKYAGFFGIKNYELFFEADEDDDGRGRIEIDFQGKIASVYLCKGVFGRDVKDLDKVAFHEAAELFCYEHFSHYLDDFDRLGNSKISAPAAHSVIRFLENELYPRITDDTAAYSPACSMSTDMFSKIRGWCDAGEADEYVHAGARILIPILNIPAVENCCGENFEEVALRNVPLTAVHVEKKRVVFNFDDILFKHDIDKDCSGKAFEETPLGIYLAKHFSEALEKYTGEVKVSLLTKENVFDENSRDFMPYFKLVGNRIKVPADKSGAWYWWLSTHYASDYTSFCYVNNYGTNYYSGFAKFRDVGVAPAFEITAEMTGV